jgi:hypothetical protein
MGTKAAMRVATDAVAKTTIAAGAEKFGMGASCWSRRSASVWSAAADRGDRHQLPEHDRTGTQCRGDGGVEGDVFVDRRACGTAVVEPGTGEAAQPGQLELEIAERGEVSGFERSGKGEETEPKPVFVEVIFGTGRVEVSGARGAAAIIHVRAPYPFR